MAARKKALRSRVTKRRLKRERLNAGGATAANAEVSADTDAGDNQMDTTPPTAPDEEIQPADEPMIDAAETEDALSPPPRKRRRMGAETEPEGPGDAQRFLMSFMTDEDRRRMKVADYNDRKRRMRPHPRP